MRPRFFAGQLLTDTELTALSTYLTEKDRLHNRYLHGTGVVCGLQVECDECGPGVRLRPGYAIDPCGADIVLPENISVNVVDLVDTCTRRERAADCDPPRAPQVTGCAEKEQSWCLWVRYVEKPGRPVSPPGGNVGDSRGCGCSGDSSAGCGCGCGGHPAGGSGAPCGCSGSARDLCSCTEAARPARHVPADCEPSRVSELYEFGVAGRDGGCCDESLPDRLSGTFPLKVVECIEHLRPVLSRGMTKAMQIAALSLVFGGKVQPGDIARDAICTLYQNVVELYRRDPVHTECVLPQELWTVDCSPFDEATETPQQYQRRMLAALEALLQLVLIYLRDCLCFALLPPCPPETCDDRVMLACVTVRDGRVVRVCNLSCRRYAGSFVNREYWMPLGPVLGWLAALVCCFPLPTRRIVPLPHDQDANGRDFGRQPAGGGVLGRYTAVLAAIRSDDFALPILWRARAGSVVRRWHPLNRLRRAEAVLAAEKGTIALAPLLHTDAAVAHAALRRQGIEVEVVEVDDRARAGGLDLVPRVAKGETATLYTLGATVVGVSGPRPIFGEAGEGS
ncbi:hypothetical protein GCM10011588_31430 [Nocardia jinanensis]|uniref:Uncharacterized protein n=1 Tax=Nocardia jinanensis TaxID=382504 RepID=A0A917VU25_9NOCA|nr:hypothetical protein [Nocardia jinanensis]GGL14615.1 hypothetical protein GCM10011588_31430 [Nocardia jinanensis]